MIVYYNIRLKSSPDLNFLQKRLGTPRLVGTAFDRLIFDIIYNNYG